MLTFFYKVKSYKIENNIIKEDDEELDNDTNSELSEEPYLFSSDEDED